MKGILFAAILGLGLSTGLAFAGEGNGDPFPFRAPGVTTITKELRKLPGKSQDPFPFRGKDIAYAPPAFNQLLVTNGAQASVQTVNSLPVGFENGTAPYEQSRSVMASLQQQSDRQIAAILMAQQKTRPADKNG